VLAEDKNHPEMHASIVETLGKLGDKRAVESLCKVLLEDKAHPEVRMAAANALGEFKDAKALESLKTAVGDEDGGVRSAAALATTKIMKEKYDREAGHAKLLSGIKYKDYAVMGSFIDDQGKKPEIQKMKVDSANKSISDLGLSPSDTATGHAMVKVFTWTLGKPEKKPEEVAEKKKMPL
jgi:hypothetical protein